jgi:hypothetical protein
MTAATASAGIPAVARAGEQLLAPLRHQLAGLLAWRTPPPLAASQLGQAAGRVGAAMLVLRSVGRGAVVERWTAADVLGIRGAQPGG